MKKMKRAMSLLLTFLIVVGMAFTGCSKKTDSEKSLVVKVNDNAVNMDEMMYYIYYTELQGSQYDAVYQSYYGSSFWDMEYSEGVTMRDYMKTSLLDQVVMYEILYDKANQEGYTLTDEDKKSSESNADTILTNLGEEQLNITGLNKEILTRIQNKLALGNKYYTDVLEGLDVNDQEITDSIKYDDYRQYNTEYLFIPTTTTDENNTMAALSDEEKAAALDTITSALDQVKAGEEFAAIVEGNDTLKTNSVNFVYGDKSSEVQYQDAAKVLENGAFSDVVETDLGYYIIKMVDNKAADSYDAAVSEAISTSEQDAFKTKFDKMKADEYKITINNEVWDPIVIGETTIVKTEEE